MIDRLKWIAAGAFAILMAVLAIVYGKQTLPVLRAKVRAKEAGSRVLKNQIERLDAEARRTAGNAEAKQHTEKANTLRMRLDEIRKEKERAIANSGGLRLSDDDVAARDNAARRARVRTSGA